MNEVTAATAPLKVEPIADAVLLFQLLTAAREVEGRLEAALDEVGLSMAKASVIKAIAHNGGSMTLGDVATCHNCVRSNVTQLVDRLEEDGLVRRGNDPEDRRVRRAVLTEEGQKAYRDGARVIGKQGRALLQALTPEEIELLRRVLPKLGS